MEKTVKFGGKDIRLAYSVFTIISYRNTFGKELFEDVERLEKLIAKNKTDSRAIEVLFKIIYSLHKPFYSDSFDHFMQSYQLSVFTYEHEMNELVKAIGELLSEGKQPSNGAVYNPKK